MHLKSCINQISYHMSWCHWHDGSHFSGALPEICDTLKSWFLALSLTQTHNELVEILDVFAQLSDTPGVQSPSPHMFLWLHFCIMASPMDSFWRQFILAFWNSIKCTVLCACVFGICILCPELCAEFACTDVPPYFSVDLSCHILCVQFVPCRHIYFAHNFAGWIFVHRILCPLRFCAVDFCAVDLHRIFCVPYFCALGVLCLDFCALGFLCTESICIRIFVH